MDRRSPFFSRNRSEEAAAVGEEAEVWRRFSDAGLLDESELRRKDREAMVGRIRQLENELYDYQHHMGLLLIEKDQQASEYEDLKQRFAEAEGIFKQEQTSHLTAISELEKQVQNFQKALVVEKQCVKDLEEALLKMSAEIADSKLTSDNKLVEVCSSEINNGKLFLQTNNQLQKDDRLQTKCTFYTTEETGHGEDLSCESDDQLAWQNRLLEGQQRIDENDIHTRLQILATKEKAVDSKQMDLERKEENLLVKEKELAAKERVGIQKLRDDHSLSLESKKHELDQKQRSFEEDWKDKLDSLEKKKIEISCRESQTYEREHALEIELKKLKHKDEEINSTLRLLKENEESLHIDEQKVKDGKEQLARDIHNLEICKSELENSRLAMKAEEEQVIREKENLIIAQLEVKQELDNCKIIKESLMKETKDLAHEKNKFDTELDALEKRRVALETELNQFIDEKKTFDDWRLIAEERLRSESQKFDRELDALEMRRVVLETEGKQVNDEKRAFNDWRLIEEERLRSESQKYDRELDALEMKRVDLETEQKQLNDEKKTFNDWRLIEEERLRSESQKIYRELDALEMKRVDLETEQKQLSDEKKAFTDWRLIEEERLRSESQKVRVDIQQELEGIRLKKKDGEIGRITVTNQNLSQLFSCSDESNLGKLKMDIDLLAREENESPTKRRKLDADPHQTNFVDEQEEFIKGRDHSPALAEVRNIYKNCGVTVSELYEPMLQTPSTASIRKNIPLDQHMDGPSSVNLGGQFPSLWKCSMQFNSSPGEIVSHPIECSSPMSVALNQEETFVSKTNFAFDRATGGDSEVSESLCTDGDTRKSEDKPSISSIDILDKRDEAESQILSSKQRGGYQGRRRGRPKTIRRNSIDAEAIVGENENREDRGQQADETSEDSIAFTETIKNCETKQTSSPGTPTSEQKRYNFRMSTINRRRCTDE